MDSVFDFLQSFSILIKIGGISKSLFLFPFSREEIRVSGFGGCTILPKNYKKHKQKI
jgi:hypothetical protein